MKANHYLYTIAVFKWTRYHKVSKNQEVETMWKVKGSQGKSDKIRELFCDLQKIVFIREFFKFPDSLSEILMHTLEFRYFSLKWECICSINGQFCTFEISHQNLVNILKDLPKTVSRSWEIFPGLFQYLSNTWSKTLKALFCLTLASAIFYQIFNFSPNNSPLKTM